MGGGHNLEIIAPAYETEAQWFVLWQIYRKTNQLMKIHRSKGKHWQRIYHQVAPMATIIYKMNIYHFAKCALRFHKEWE